jgi:hypothetical protein
MSYVYAYSDYNSCNSAKVGRKNVNKINRDKYANTHNMCTYKSNVIV